MWTRRTHKSDGRGITPRRILCRILLAGVLAVCAPTVADPELPPEFYPEHHQVDALLETNSPPQGVMLLIRNQREDALVELLPRAGYYAQYLGRGCRAFTWP